MKYIFGIAALLLIVQSAGGAFTTVNRLPAGLVTSFAGTACPTYSEEADGSSLLRAGKYANLFTAVGTAHGTADGTHFNKPDYRGKFIRGWSHGTANDPDRAGRTAAATGGATGDNVGSVQGYQIQSHAHGTPDYPVPGPGGISLQSPDWGSVGSGTYPAGGSETRPINANVLYCVWY